MRRVVVVDWHGEPESDPRDRGVDADDASAAVGECAARVAGIERGVGRDDILDESGREPCPRRERAPERAHHARRDGPREPERAPDGDLRQSRDETEDRERAPGGARV
jgi:hypothetical protein